MAVFALLLAVVCFLLGLTGTVLPVLPGAILIYAGMLVYGLLTKFASLDATFFLLQGLALLLVFIIDFLAAAAGTRRFGGGKAAAWGAAVGTLAGVIFFGPLGLLAGPFLGAVVAEIIFGKKTADQAVRAGFGTLFGLVGGTFLKLFVEIVMIIYFFFTI
ncbi:MAG: DUF456 domain-containing protein [Firmicutes bacterium]|nr:DUF456 domain-containing protein [Bacillota bacterium]